MKSQHVLPILGLITASSAFAFPLTLPNESVTKLSLSGNPLFGYGLTGYRNAAIGVANTGHQVSNVIQGAPPPAAVEQPQTYLRADYYITSLDRSPFSNDRGAEAVAAAHATEVATTNMVNLALVMANPALDYEEITISFGQKAGNSIQDSWNLGADTLNQDWTGNLASTIENRIYTANSNNVEATLSYAGTEIITFGHSNLYEILNYDLINGDTVSAYSDQVSASLNDGLIGDALNVGQAIIDDINAGGGLVQLYFDTVQLAAYITDSEEDAGTEYIHANYSFTGSLMVVPEPSAYAALLGGATLALTVIRRRRR